MSAMLPWVMERNPGIAVRLFMRVCILIAPLVRPDLAQSKRDRQRQMWQDLIKEDRVRVIHTKNPLGAIKLVMSQTDTVWLTQKSWRFLKNTFLIFFAEHLTETATPILWDKRWKSGFIFYLGFVSASRRFIDWLQRQLQSHLAVYGYITTARKKDYYYQLKYAKEESLKILKRMYYSDKVVCLPRKYLKIKKMLAIVGKSL